MLAKRDIAALPRADEPALVLPDADRREAIEAAHARIAPMYWGPRISLTEARRTICRWLAQLEL